MFLSDTVWQFPNCFIVETDKFLLARVSSQRTYASLRHIHKLIIQQYF